MDSFFTFLRRSPLRRGRGWLGGICAGIAAYFGWDVTLVRIGVLLSFLLPFIGVGTYLVAWLLLPRYDGRILLESLIGRTTRPGPGR
ncbi:DNA-binding transcriptional activator PspC [Arthrobacter saudimassiliensis]|uniref:DNA-binding transcriptional activator PspC n=1 Tax=Arthrobacter saudimassiliensis TaxID=1461584 RepID=A0A078MTY1_9MICC|nr:DNA-binding transcriptional activator PspC [Arthrobacter saudimassiliensis]